MNFISEKGYNDLSAIKRATKNIKISKYKRNIKINIRYASNSIEKQFVLIDINKITRIKRRIKYMKKSVCCCNIQEIDIEERT